MSSGSPARKRRRAEALRRSRAALVDAAIELFGAHGFDAPSLDAICARAGYTRGAFYVHFKDRDELLAAAMDRVLGSFLSAVTAPDASGHDLDSAITRFAGAFASFRAQRRRTGTRARRGTATELLPPIAALRFHRILDACARSTAVRRKFVALVTGATERLRQAARKAQRSRSVHAGVDPRALAGLLCVVAIGILVAEEIELPLDPLAISDVLLRLLAPRPARAPHAILAS